MTPVTCGTPASESNAVPPLKSASRKLTSCVVWAEHSARIQVTRSSDFPDPVTPATTACGPSRHQVDHARLSRFHADHRGQSAAGGAGGSAEQRAERDRLQGIGRAHQTGGASSQLVRDDERLRVAEGFHRDLAHLAAGVEVRLAGRTHGERDAASGWARGCGVGAHDRDVGGARDRLAR